MILLSFDIEEFDMPLEYGVDIGIEQQLQVAYNGTQTILDLLKEEHIHATFYCTANFAQHHPGCIKRMVKEGHEIASHGYYHSTYQQEHLIESKHVLENISNVTVRGFRMPRMMPVSDIALSEAGYLYNSSINPTLLLGRYNNLKMPRTYFYSNNILQLPTSVSPVIRFPLFWLSFHNLPLKFYCWLCKKTMKQDGYLNIYFHPWEFENISHYRFPFYVVRNSGEKMHQRLQQFIHWAKSKGYTFTTTLQFLDDYVAKRM